VRPLALASGYETVGITWRRQEITGFPCVLGSKTIGGSIADGTWNVPATFMTVWRNVLLLSETWIIPHTTGAAE